MDSSAIRSASPRIRSIISVLAVVFDAGAVTPAEAKEAMSLILGFIRERDMELSLTAEKGDDEMLH
jgi:hypothetical protein